MNQIIKSLNIYYKKLMAILRQSDCDLLLTVHDIIDSHGLFIAPTFQQGSQRFFFLFLLHSIPFMVRCKFYYNIVIAVCLVDFPDIVRQLDIFFLLFLFRNSSWTQAKEAPPLTFNRTSPLASLGSL